MSAPNSPGGLSSSQRKDIRCNMTAIAPAACALLNHVGVVDDAGRRSSGIAEGCRRNRPMKKSAVRDGDPTCTVIPSGSARACTMAIVCGWQSSADKKRFFGPIRAGDRSGHRHCFAGSGGFIEHRRVGQGHRREIADHRLKVQQRFEPALRDLGLVRGCTACTSRGSRGCCAGMTGGVMVSEKPMPMQERTILFFDASDFSSASISNSPRRFAEVQRLLDANRLLGTVFSTSSSRESSPERFGASRWISCALGPTCRRTKVSEGCSRRSAGARHLG